MVPLDDIQTPFFYDLVNGRKLQWLDQTLATRWGQLENPFVNLTPDGMRLLVAGDQELQMFHLSSRPDSGDEYVAALSAGRFEIPNCAQNSCSLTIDDSGNLLRVQDSDFEHPKAQGYNQLFHISRKRRLKT